MESDALIFATSLICQSEHLPAAFASASSMPPFGLLTAQQQATKVIQSVGCLLSIHPKQGLLSVLITNPPMRHSQAVPIAKGFMEGELQRQLTNSSRDKSTFLPGSQKRLIWNASSHKQRGMPRQPRSVRAFTEASGAHDYPRQPRSACHQDQITGGYKHLQQDTVCHAWFPPNGVMGS